MHDRSGETSGAGDTPIAAVRAGEVPELESRGELAMSKLSSGKEPRADARHVPSLSAEQASARLEKTLGARWRALSDAEKSRLVASARASFQEAEQRKRLAKADPGASKPSADPARDTTHAPAERAPREHRDEARAAPEAASEQPPAPVPEPTPAPSPADPAPPVKRKRGRPPKVKPPTPARRRRRPRRNRKTQTERVPGGRGGEKTKHLGVHRGRSPLFPARRGGPGGGPRRGPAGRGGGQSGRAGRGRGVRRHSPAARHFSGEAWRASWTAPSPAATSSPCASTGVCSGGSSGTQTTRERRECTREVTGDGTKERGSIL